MHTGVRKQTCRGTVKQIRLAFKSVRGCQKSHGSFYFLWPYHHTREKAAQRESNHGGGVSSYGSLVAAAMYDWSSRM